MFINYNSYGVQVMSVPWFSTCTVRYSDGYLFVPL